MDRRGGKSHLKLKKDLVEELNLTEVFFENVKWENVHCEGQAGHKNNIPARRWGHKFFYYNDRVYMLGGHLGRKSKVSCALYQLDMQDTPIWTRINTEGKGPKSIDSHTVEIFGNSVYTFCGNVDDRPSNSVYRMDLITMIWEKTELSFAQTRESHIGIKLNDSTVVLHGGSSGVSSDNMRTYPMGDELMVIVDVDQEKYRKVDYEHEVKGKGPRERESHNYVKLEDVYYVFGGISINTLADDEASLDGILQQEGMFIEIDKKIKRTRRNLRDLYAKEGSRTEDKEPINAMVIEIDKPEDAGDVLEMKIEEVKEVVEPLKETDLKEIDLLQELKDEKEEKEKMKIEEQVQEAEEEVEEISDFMNDLYSLKISMIDRGEMRYEFQWTRIDFKGKVPQIANFCFFAQESSRSLIIVGGEGYRVDFKYDKDDAGDTLDQIYCIKLDENLAFEIKSKDLEIEAFDTGSCFVKDSLYYIYGGRLEDEKMSSKMHRLTLEPSGITDFDQNIEEFKCEELRYFCESCKRDWKSTQKQAQKADKVEKKDVDSRVARDRVEVKIKEFKQEKIIISQDVLDDFGKMLLYDESEFCGAFILGNAVLSLVKRRELKKVRFEVSHPNLFMMGIMETPIKSMIISLEDEIVTSELYNLAMFAKELKGAMRLYFRHDNGYCTFSTPLVNETDDEWVEGTKMALKHYSDFEELQNPMKKYLKRYDFFIIFGFPIVSRYLEPLSAKKGEISLPIPKNYNFGFNDKEKDNEKLNMINWNLRYFFSFYFRNISNQDLEMIISRELVNLRFLSKLLRGHMYVYKYNRQWKTHMIIYQLKDINRFVGKTYRFLESNHTSLCYNDEHLEQCKQYYCNTAAILLMSN